MFLNVELARESRLGLVLGLEALGRSMNAAVCWRWHLAWVTHDEDNDGLFREAGVRGDHLPVVEDGVDPFRNRRHCATSAGDRRCWYTRRDEGG